MKVEKQVVSLELAKQLKELGMKEKSIFSWNKYKEVDGSWYWKIETHRFCCDCYCDGLPEDRTIPAYTSAELMDKLPKWITVEKNSQEEYFCSSEFFVHNTIADTMADAMAKMLIYLLQNGLITNK